MAGKRGEGVLLSLFLHPSTASPRIKSASNRLRGRHCSMGGGILLKMMCGGRGEGGGRVEVRLPQPSRSSLIWVRRWVSQFQYRALEIRHCCQP